MSTRLALAAIGLASLFGCSSTVIQQSEGASGYSPKLGWSATKFAVAAANPLATQAGYDILKTGSSAVDAAIAVQMVLGLVEPQSSGIGGGAFLLHQAINAKCASKVSQAQCGLQAFDGRETAPALASQDLFIGKDGKPMALMDAVVGGRSVGTLGAVRMLELAHQQHGKLAWASLFKPAIDLATNGFAVSPRMSTLLARDVHLKQDPVALAYFYDRAGRPWPTGHLLKNPEYAEVLKMIAKDGSKALNEGAVAETIVRKVQSHPNNPGLLSMADLSNYQPKERAPFCTDYTAQQKQYVICGMPPPSSGAIAIAQIFGMLGQASTSANHLSADWLHHYANAARLALADRAQYVADPDFVAPPAGDWHSLVAPDYLLNRVKSISKQAAPNQPEHGTSHISIVDGFGNALAMTTTIEYAWGSHLMVNRGKLDADGKPILGGFLLNNQLTDFSFTPTDANGKSIANRVEAGKRPRSSMSPTLMFDKATGRLAASVGSPGGELIIHYVAKTLYGMLNWQLSPQDAINLPNFAVMDRTIVLEKDRFPAATIEALKARGHFVVESPLTSGLQGIQKTPVGWLGGADPRREGVVLGD